MAQAILLKDVENLGGAGEAVDVSPGYLRNYLLPRKLAQPATAASLEEARRRREAAEERERQAAERAGETAALLSKTVLTIQHRAGEDGRLYGSVTTKEIADAISEARGLRIDRKKIRLDDPIRQVGTYMVEVELAASVLGAMMVAEGAIAPVILDVRLGAEDFYRERHRIVFRAISHLYEKGEPVDALTVSELLTQHGEIAEAGGKETVSELASTVPAPGNARHYAQIVKQNALLRRLLATSQQIQKSVHEREGEPGELVERAESLLFKVAHEERASDFRRVADVLGDEIDRLEALAKGDQAVTGTPAGFRDLDSKLGGFQPGNLIVLAARPSLGKSALVCNIAENVATKAGLPVAFFSLEMSEAELAHRLIACRSRIPG